MPVPALQQVVLRSSNLLLQTRDFIARRSAAGVPTTSTQAARFDRFIRALISGGAWDYIGQGGLLVGVSDLAGCLVPYKLVGTETVTNQGPFTSLDYVDTGATAGLTGNGSKRLDCGVNGASYWTGYDQHVCAVLAAYTSRFLLMGADSGSSPRGAAIYTVGANICFITSGNSSLALAAASDNAGFRFGESRAINDHRVYARGATDATATSTTNVGAFATSSVDLGVFSRNGDTNSGNLNGRLTAYSFGLSMTDAARIAYSQALWDYMNELGCAIGSRPTT